MPAIIRVLSLVFWATLAMVSSGWAQTDASPDQARDLSGVARIEALLKDRSVLLVPRFLVLDRSDTVDFLTDYQVVALPYGGVLDAVIRQLVVSDLSPETVMRNLLLFDRTYRAELAREFNISLPAPTTGNAGQATAAEGEEPSPPVVPAAVLPFAWAGRLDLIELADVTAQFDARTGQTLQSYSATPITLILDPSGTVEIAGQAVCEVKTRTETTNGQDFVIVRTVTSYEIEGPQSLRGNWFKVRVRIQRWTENSAGPMGAPGTPCLSGMQN